MCSARNVASPEPRDTDLGAVQSVIAQVYKASLDPARWNEVAEAATRSFAADGAMVQMRPVRPGLSRFLSVTHNFDDDTLAELDPLIASYAGVEECGAQCDTTGITGWRIPRVREQTLVKNIAAGRSNFAGGRRLLCGIFAIDEQSLGLCLIYRHPGAPCFTEDEVGAFKEVLLHLRLALQISSRVVALETERLASFAILESFALGVLIVGAAGRVRFANTVAQRLLRGGHGIALSRGRLRTQDPRQGAQLEQLIARAAVVAGRGIDPIGTIGLARADGLSMSLVVSPLPMREADFGVAEAAALVLINDPDAAPKHIPSTLASLYGLTQAQAGLMAALVDGQRLSTYAEAKGVTLDTARFHLKQIFERTGYSRQSDIIRGVLFNPIAQLMRQDAS